MDNGIQKYQAFIKAVEHGSFTKAAEALDYAQSSVSKMIADLENEWGVHLLERSRSGVALTSDGMAMLPLARELADCYRRIQEQAAELRGVQTGLIRIGTFSSVATHWMPNIISAFQRDYPNIRYEMLLGDYTEIERWIAEGRVDCGFLPLPASPDFETVLIERDAYVAVLPQDHPLRKQEAICPEDLDGQAFLLLEHGGKTEVSAYLERCRVKPDVRFTTWDDYAVMSMVEKGLGVAILPQLILKRSPYRLETRRLARPLVREIGLATYGGRTASAAVKRFIPYLSYR